MIQEKLEKSRISEEKELAGVQAVKDVKLLLDSNSQAEQMIMLNAFPNSVNSLINNEQQAKKNVKKLAAEHKGEVYTIGEIKKLCMSYRLRFLPSTLYKGNLPVDALHEMRRIFTENDTFKSLSGSTTRGFEMSVFMVAPAEMFNLKKGVKAEELKAAKLKKIEERDPALFLRIDSEHFLFVKEWGNSFSPLRKLLGSITGTYTAVKSLYYSFVTLLFAAMMYGSIYPITHNMFSMNVNIICVVLGSFLSLFVLVSSFLSGESAFLFAKWKNYKKPGPDNRIATEYNWNTTDSL